MSGMFNRYGTVGDDVRLDIITRNLSPFYTMQLPVVNSVQELEQTCLKLQVKKFEADHYVLPTQKRSNYVEPSFAFVSHASSSGVDSESTSNITPNAHVAAVQYGVACWNCNHVGHTFRNCPSPK